MTSTAHLLPRPRGPLSAFVVEMMEGPVPGLDARLPSAPCGPHDPADELLALWTLQELHYRGFDGVDETWEWHPCAVSLRVRLEHDVENRLRRRWRRAEHGETQGDLATELFSLVADDDAPSLARHLHHRGDAQQVLDMLRQRSVYHLKEADPTSWVVPRLDAVAKAALVEIQFDEYGAGDPSRLHHHLFARGLEACGLDAAYGAYVDEAVPEVLEQNVVLTMFGLHRRLRAAAVGHFAAFEATSSGPSRLLAQALRRLDLPEAMAAYYDEHVEADAVHEQLAARALCASVADGDPHLRDEVLFGAWTCLDLEARTATALLSRWEDAA